MNPYLIPGLEDTPTAPLSPHTNEDHHKFYVAVDGMAIEFRRFQDTMHSVQQLTEEGRIVVVTGESGCGKTSLINRCAAWLRAELVESGLQVMIISLTKSAKPDQAITLRMEQVITDVVDHLSDEKHGVRTEEIELLRQRIRDIQEITRNRSVIDRERQKQHIARVDRAYRFIAKNALRDDQIAIILLPPSSDLVSEIRYYADFAMYPRIVFFAETDRVNDVKLTCSQIPTNDRRRPILLQVGPLNIGDGWTYAQARQSGDPTDRSFPPVSEETMRRVTAGGAVSIRRLHLLLYRVYNDFASENIPRDSLPLREVSFDHIAECFFRWVFGESGNMS